MPPVSRLHLFDFYVAGNSSTGASDLRCPSFTRSKRRLGRHLPFSRTAPASSTARSSTTTSSTTARTSSPDGSTIFDHVLRHLALSEAKPCTVSTRASVCLLLFCDIASSCDAHVHNLQRTAASTTCLRSTLMRPPQPSTLNRRHRQCVNYWQVEIVYLQG